MGLVPFLQPIVYLTDRRVLGFEVLARWVDGSDVRPASDFLENLPPAAWRAADVWLYRRVLRARTPGMVFLNLSPAFLARPERLRRVLDAVAGQDDPGRVVLEVSERYVPQDLCGFRDVLAAVRADGFRLAIDDFGNGFSSFQYLRVLPVDFLKVDRSYVFGLHHSPDNRRFLEAFLALARVVQAEVIAEGVEAPEDLRVLQDMGVSLGQGFLLGEPRPLFRFQIAQEAST